MARFTPAVLFFFFATLISHAFTLPLLRRDDISKIEAAIQLATGDVTNLQQTFNRASWGHTLAAEANEVSSEFSTTSNDIQNCINQLNSITNSVNAGDADILLKLAQDFGNTVTGLLGTLRYKYSYYKKVNMAWSILNEIRNLSGGVKGMTGKLKSVLPYQSQGVASGLQQQMGSAFQQTISLYASS